MQNINVKRNCDGDFPEWKPDIWAGGVEFETPDICKECDFLMICTARNSADIMNAPYLKTTPEGEEVQAKAQKAIMMWARGEMSEEDMGQEMIETQKKITDLGL